MNNLQSVSIVAAFPIGAVIVMIAASFLKDAKKYQAAPSRNTRQWKTLYVMMADATACSSFTAPTALVDGPADLSSCKISLRTTCRILKRPAIL